VMWKAKRENIEMTEPAATLYYMMDFRWSVHAYLLANNAT